MISGPFCDGSLSKPLPSGASALRLLLSFGDGLLHNGQNSLIEMSLKAVTSDCQSVSVVSQGLRKVRQLRLITD